MIPITVERLAVITGGRIICGDKDELIGPVITDSREVSSGDMFIPLRGEKFDGHDYALQALKSGAAGILTEKEFPCYEGKFMVLVDDTRVAMKKLAMYIRDSLSIPFIAIIGSVGKTTTKDMVASVLSQKFSVLKTDGNFNNDVGVPLTMFRLTEAHQCAVIEMGMNHFGEIRYLSEMVRPDYVVMTNIGDAHIENLGSRLGILKAKSEVFEFASENAVAVLNGDDELLRTLRDELSCSTVFCGESEDCDVLVSDIDLQDGLQVSCNIGYCGTSFSVDIPAAGRHMIYSSAQAAYIGMRLGLTPEEIRAGILEFAPTKMRMNVKRFDKEVVVLDDAYNANPQSMAAGVEILAGMKGKRIAVLGDMLELGDYGVDAHAEIGRLCSKLDIDCVLTYGQLAQKIAHSAGKRARHFSEREKLSQVLISELETGCTVLIKASRGMHFETFTQVIEEKLRHD